MTVQRLCFLVLLVLLAATAPVRAGSEPALERCGALAKPRGQVLRVSTVTQLREAVRSCPTGGTILLADGSSRLDGATLVFGVPGVTLRSASGERDRVVLDGEYRSPELVQITASQVTIADLTLKQARYHPIHIMSAPASDTLDTTIYNVHIVDPGQQAIKINPVKPGHYPDHGLIACSRIELTSAGRAQVRDNCYTGGIDAHAARDWVVRDNVIEGFWCPRGLSEHAVHFWSNSRDTVVERNFLVNNARGIGLGLEKGAQLRVYPDHPESDSTGHLGGVVRNNMIYAGDPALFASAFGFDCGVSLWYAKGARVLHNTVFSADPAHSFASIEWRFPETQAEVVNNLVNVPLRERDGARAFRSGNVAGAAAAWFADAPAGDLRLSPLGLARLVGVPVPGEAPDDFRGVARTGGFSYPGADGQGRVVAPRRQPTGPVAPAAPALGGS